MMIFTVDDIIAIVLIVFIVLVLGAMRIVAKIVSRKHR